MVVAPSTTTSSIPYSPILWVRRDQMSAIAYDAPIDEPGNPRASVAIALLAALILVGAYAFGVWAAMQTGSPTGTFATNVFLLLAVPGTLIGASLGLNAAFVHSPALLNAMTASMLLNAATRRHQDRVGVDSSRVMLNMGRLWSIQAKVRAVGGCTGLRLAAAAVFGLGLYLALMHWPGAAAIQESLFSAATSAASIVAGIIVANALSFTAMVASNVEEIDARVRNALVNIRKAEQNEQSTPMPAKSHGSRQIAKRS